jgi:hypothetical protein
MLGLVGSATDRSMLLVRKTDLDAGTSTLVTLARAVDVRYVARQVVRHLSRDAPRLLDAHVGGEDNEHYRRIALIGAG